MDENAPETPAVNPLDPLGIGKAALGVWQALATQPDAFLQTQMRLADAWLSVSQQDRGQTARHATQPSNHRAWAG